MKILFFLTLSVICFSPLTALAFNNCKMVNEIILDDLIFDVNANGLWTIGFSDQKYASQMSALIQSTGSNTQEKKIDLVNNKGVLCKTFRIHLNEIKLCKDADGKIEPWRFLTCPDSDSTHCHTGEFSEPSLSVLSLRILTLEDDVHIKHSSVCGAAVITGEVSIEGSYISEADI